MRREQLDPSKRTDRREKILQTLVTGTAYHGSRALQGEHECSLARALMLSHNLGCFHAKEAEHGESALSLVNSKGGCYTSTHGRELFSPRVLLQEQLPATPTAGTAQSPFVARGSGRCVVRGSSGKAEMARLMARCRLHHRSGINRPDASSQSACHSIGSRGSDPLRRRISLSLRLSASTLCRPSRHCARSSMRSSMWRVCDGTI